MLWRLYLWESRDVFSIKTKVKAYLEPKTHQKAAATTTT